MSLESVFIPKEFSNPEIWRRILKEWIALIKNYCIQSKGERDVPYWYGERALTGLLSAAAWRLETGWALEEFCTLRGEESEASIGRGDLWIGVGEKSYTAEAKITWPEGDLEKAKERVHKKLDEAREQLLDIENSSREGTAISVCYVVPCPKVEKPASKKPNNSELLKELINSFYSEGCAVALFIPDGDPPIEDERTYPGVALVSRVESWPNKDLNIA